MTSGSDLASTLGNLLGGFVALPQVQLALRLAVWAMLVSWGLATVWVIRDAARRSPHLLVVGAAGIAMVLASPFGFIEALIVWLLVRPRWSVAESREQRLTIEALEVSAHRERCAACGARSDAAWRRCPYCRTWLLAPCPRCERLVELDASICPWCVTSLPPGVLQPRVARPGTVPVMAVLPAQPVESVPVDVQALAEAAAVAAQPLPPVPAVASSGNTRRHRRSPNGPRGRQAVPASGEARAS